MPLLVDDGPVYYTFAEEQIVYLAVLDRIMLGLLCGMCYIVSYGNVYSCLYLNCSFL